MNYFDLSFSLILVMKNITLTKIMTIYVKPTLLQPEYSLENKVNHDMRRVFLLSLAALV